jgi:hypothetical protein
MVPPRSRQPASHPTDPADPVSHGTGTAPMLISTAYAQDLSGHDVGSMGSATQFLPLVLIFVVFYFLLIRPQQQKQKEMRLGCSVR